MGDGNGILEWNNKFYLNIFFHLFGNWISLKDFSNVWMNSLTTWFLIFLTIYNFITCCYSHNKSIAANFSMNWMAKTTVRTIAIYLTMNCMWNRIWDCFYERTVSPNNWCYTKVAANMRHILSIDKINVERLMLFCDFNHVVHITYSKWDKIRTCEVWGVVIYHVRKKRSIRHSHMYAGMLRSLDCQVKR